MIILFDCVYLNVSSPRMNLNIWDVVSGEGLKPTNSKIKAVTEWPTPKLVQNVQQWLGFCNFYRRYIRNYSHIAAPLYQITKRDKREFSWNLTHQQAFVKLKTALTTAPLLRNPRCGSNEEFYISTDASNYAVGAVLLQKDINGHMQPCAYYSKQEGLPYGPTSYHHS